MLRHLKPGEKVSQFVFMMIDPEAEPYTGELHAYQGSILNSPDPDYSKNSISVTNHRFEVGKIYHLYVTFKEDKRPWFTDTDGNDK